jgi:small-conductance mechanosensitive channel
MDIPGLYQGPVYRCFAFHLINHPFDCGDRVVIDNEEMTVLRIDLMYTTYMNQNGRVRYIPNAAMFLKNVDNIRRSDIQSEDVEISVNKSTSFSQVLSLKDKVKGFLESKAKDFTGNIYIKNYEMGAGDELMKLVICIEHNSNFQDPQPRYARREEFLTALEQSLDNSGITYDHCFVFKD